MRQIFLNGVGIQMERLTDMGDPLIKLEKVINWEMFRKPLEAAIRKPDYNKGGRPPYDVILMLKIVMLMSWYGLSYNQAQYQINDRLSFIRFLGVEVGYKLPDENTIWDFKEAIKEHELERELFEQFNSALADYGYQLNSGSMVDASFVEVPRRRVIKEKELKEPEKLLENEAISVTLEETEDAILVHANDERTQHILNQTDFDARFTKKGGATFFGYKDHASVDKDTKVIIDYDVTSADVHDSRVFTQFVTPETGGVWADSAYLSGDIINELKDINPDIEINICNRPYRNKPLTEEQKEENRVISQVRARVEHVFGIMTRSMGGMILNCVGIQRIKRDVGLKNLGYNIKRFVYLAG